MERVILDKNDKNVLFSTSVNSQYKGKREFAHFYVTESKIILTKLSKFNLLTQAGTTIAGALDGEYKLIASFEKAKLEKISRTRLGLNGKCCRFSFTDDEIIIVFDSPKKTLEKIKQYLPSVLIDFE